MRYGLILIVMLAASLSAACGPRPPAALVVDASCDFRHVEVPADLRPRFYDPDGRVRAGLPAADAGFAVSVAGNNLIREKRCGGRADQ